MQLSTASVTCLLGVEQGVEEFCAVVKGVLTCLLGVEQGGDVHLDKMFDVPVVVHARGHGSDSAVPGQGCCCARCCCDRCAWFQTFRKRLEVPQMQFCVAGDVPVTMQR